MYQKFAFDILLHTKLGLCPIDDARKLLFGKYLALSKQ
jgi:hypothetical protein